MAEIKRIRALERGLRVLEELQARSGASLKDLHDATTLPRPTLIRILATLEGLGVVRRSIGDGLYRATFRLQRMAEGLDAGDHLADVAAPIIDALCRKVTWPSDLAVPDPESGEDMVLKETSRPTSPIMLNRDQLGRKVCMTLSAVGRVYLAFCSDEKRAGLIGTLAKSKNPLNRRMKSQAAFEAELAHIKTHGYAVRDESFGGGQSQLISQFDDGLQSLAVPLVGSSGVHGAVSLVWPRKASDVDAFVAEYLEELQSAAADIVTRLEPT